MDGDGSGGVDIAVSELVVRVKEGVAILGYEEAGCD